MSDIAVSVEGLGKLYRIGERESYYTLRDTLTRSFSASFNWLKGASNGKPVTAKGTHQSICDVSRSEFIWALKDVSFTIKRGEVVGIIGRNGAGKSTLLKVLSRITEPSEGEARIYGRVGSLLEIGTGFHSELTGRENIYLNGAILGMKKAEIDGKFDEIVAFAEIEKFIDTPVKHYSSGTYMRLAFSVAAHLEPEILIVDEVLAVGDAAFQKKCLGRMGDVAREGRTVLFVSHNMEAVQRLCNRALFLNEGTIAKDGETPAVVSTYLTLSRRILNERYRHSSMQPPRGSKATLIEAEALNAAGDPCARLRFAEPFSVRMRWFHSATIQGASYSIRVFDESDRLLFAVNTLNEPITIEEEGVHEIKCTFTHNVLVPGDYYISIGCYVRPHSKIQAIEPCLRLVVLDIPFYPTNSFNVVGSPVFAMRPSWKIENFRVANRAFSF